MWDFADSAIILSGSPNHLYILRSNWLRSFSGCLFLFGFCRNGFEWSTGLKKTYLSYSRSSYYSTFKPAFFRLAAVHKQNDLKSWRVGFVCSRLVQWNKPILKKFCTISNMIKNLSNVVLFVWFSFIFWTITAYQWNWNCSFFFLIRKVSLPEIMVQRCASIRCSCSITSVTTDQFILAFRQHFMIHYSLPVHLCAYHILNYFNNTCFTILNIVGSLRSHHSKVKSQSWLNETTSVLRQQYRRVERKWKEDKFHGSSEILRNLK